MVGVMITNGGPHPASKLAAATVQQLVQIGPDATLSQQVLGEELKAKFQALLERRFAEAQKGEQDELKVDAKRLLTRLAPDEDYVNGVVAEMLTLTDGTEFTSHFLEPHVQEYIRNVVRQMFKISMEVERGWFADRNPDKAEAKEYKEKRREAPYR